MESAWMITKGDPRDVPEWHALQRGAALVRHLIGSGLTALGKANYADMIGQYYTAFFGLSVGLERLTKLILVIDYVLSNNGQMPKQKVVSKFGHKLLDLMNAVEGIVPKHELALAFQRPRTVTSAKVIGCLDSFADASRGRYANFVTVGDPSLGSVSEPIGKWWVEVGESILQEHYYGKQAQIVVEAKARQVNALSSDIAAVFHTDERGNTINDIYSASVRSGQTELIQQFGRYISYTPLSSIEGIGGSIGLLRMKRLERCRSPT
jgi:hypothetical protein